MKRSILASVSALAVFAAAPAIAQDNTSTVEQTGSGAVATVTQDGANDVSDVEQRGGGTVTVEQTGVTGSTSTVITGADDRPPESTVDVTQSDDGTSSEANGQANVSTVNQLNVNGFGASGTGSTVEVTQTHNAAGTGQNSSLVNQGVNAVSGQVTVDQQGGDNSSIYNSTTSTDNDANIMQTGASNASNVRQDFQNGSALASVTQINAAGGALNSATIEQISTDFALPPPDEFALGADASIVQDGEGNTSSISQTGFASTLSEANFARNTQTGDEHDSSIDQSGIDNIANVTQSGFSNESFLTQSGDRNSATVVQTSSNNTSTITQSGDGSTATVTQGGAPGV